jgi:hypothetical protein
MGARRARRRAGLSRAPRIRTAFAREIVVKPLIPVDSMCEH